MSGSMVYVMLHLRCHFFRVKCPGHPKQPNFAHSRIHATTMMVPLQQACDEAVRSILGVSARTRARALSGLCCGQVLALRLKIQPASSAAPPLRLYLTRLT